MNALSACFRVQKEASGFTLLDLMLSVAILGLLAALAVPLHLDSVKKAKEVEGQAAVAEVLRLEQLHYGNTGTYTANLQELGFNLYSALQYSELFIRVQQDTRGWGYLAVAMPLSGDGNGWAVARYPGAQAAPSSPTPLKGGGSACSAWTGWGAMEGGRIEGEERINSSSSSTGNNGSPCGGRRVVDHGKK